MNKPERTTPDPQTTEWRGGTPSSFDWTPILWAVGMIASSLIGVAIGAFIVK